MTSTKATCGACGRDITVKRDGTFRQHQAWLTGNAHWTHVQFPPVCEGTGRTPQYVAEGGMENVEVGGTDAIR